MMFYRPETPTETALRVHADDPEAGAWRRADREAGNRVWLELQARIQAGETLAELMFWTETRRDEIRDELLTARGIDYAGYLARIEATRARLARRG